MHDTNIITQWDNWTEENNNGQHLLIKKLKIFLEKISIHHVILTTGQTTIIYFKYAISYQNPLVVLCNPVDSAGVINYKGLK